MPEVGHAFTCRCGGAAAAVGVVEIFSHKQTTHAGVSSANERPKHPAAVSLSILSRPCLSEHIQSRLLRQIVGKGSFKEEFVTCGGVALSALDMRTMESKSVPGLFFAGEVVDVDGVTGGFNFQSAWTTGWVAGSAVGAANTARTTAVAAGCADGPRN